MARLARVVVPGVWHHVTQRGNRRQTVFHSDVDRATYLQFLARHCPRAAVRITGYCLMGNHVHLIAVPDTAAGLANALGRTHVDYARWLNLRSGETGHLWQDRFYSCPLDDRHQWEALRYVELNPVRAGIAPEAAAWPWSSASAHLTGIDRTGLVDLSEWQRSWTSDRWRDALALGIEDSHLLTRLREATRTGRPLGSADFIATLESRLHRPLRPAKRGPKP